MHFRNIILFHEHYYPAMVINNNNQHCLGDKSEKPQFKRLGKRKKSQISSQLNLATLIREIDLV